MFNSCSSNDCEIFDPATLQRDDTSVTLAYFLFSFALFLFRLFCTNYSKLYKTVCIISFFNPYEATKFFANYCRLSPSLTIISPFLLAPSRIESFPNTLAFFSSFSANLLAVFSVFIDF